MGASAFFAPAADFELDDGAGEALAAEDEVAPGTWIICWHLGHFPDFPAMLSGALRLYPHWQVTWIGIRVSFLGDGVR